MRALRFLKACLSLQHLCVFTCSFHPVANHLHPGHRAGSPSRFHAFRRASIPSTCFPAIQPNPTIRFSSTAPASDRGEARRRNRDQGEHGATRGGQNKRRKKHGTERRPRIPNLNHCETVEEVLNVHQSHGQHMTAKHLSLSWNQIKKLVSSQRAERQGLMGNQDRLFKPLLDHTRSVMDTFQPIPLSVTGHSLAKIGTLTRWDPPPTTWVDILQQSKNTVDHLDPRAIANLMWAFATVGLQPDDELLDNMSRAALAQGLQNFIPQGLSNLAWSFAKMGGSNAGRHQNDLFDAVAEESLTRLHEFNSQALCNLAWSFATINHGSEMTSKLFDGMAETSVHRLDKFNSQALANMAWAFAKIHSLSESEKVCNKATSTLFHEMSAASMPLLEQDKFNAQGLANLAWAFATMGQNNPELIDRIANASVSQLAYFNPQGLANLAWAFATISADHKDGTDSPGVNVLDLFDGIAETSVHRLDKFNSQALANMAWAFAKIHSLSDSEQVSNKAMSTLFGEIAAASKPLLEQDKFNAQGLANLAWAFATTGQTNPELLSMIAKRSRSRQVDSN